MSDFVLKRAGKPEFFVVHHTATTNDSIAAINGLMAESQWWLSTEKKNYWKSLGYKADYHIYIRRDGSYVLGQPVALNSTNAGNDYYNNRALSACLIGRLHEYPPTPEQLKTLAKSFFWAKRLNPKIKPLRHSDIVSTNCPGTYFPWKEFLKMIDETVIYVRIKDETAVVNGKPTKLPIYPFVVESNGGHTVVPLRFIAEALGATVEWDQVRKAIKITK